MAIAAPASAFTKKEDVDEEEDPVIRFTTVNKLLNQINHTLGDILIVTRMFVPIPLILYFNPSFIDVSPQDFTMIESRRRNFRLRRYYANSQILIITIPTPLHEALHLALYQQFCSAIINLVKSWRSIGSTTYRSQGHPGGDGGEGDSTGGPKPERGKPNDWPTLVIESGDSESLSRLRMDMEWWFRTSNHQVKIVLLAKFNHHRCEIQLEKWEEEPQAVRPGAMTTRLVAARVAAGTLTPVKRQRRTITRSATNPPSFNVARGALVLSFRLLFLRNPGPGEGDFVFGIPDLQVYAAHVWDQVRD